MIDDLEIYRVAYEFSLYSIFEIGIILAIGAFNYFFLYIMKIVHGKWYSIIWRPIWTWGNDYSKFVEIMETERSDTIKKKYKTLQNGLIISIWSFIVIAVLGTIFT